MHKAVLYKEVQGLHSNPVVRIVTIFVVLLPLVSLIDSGTLTEAFVFTLIIWLISLLLLFGQLKTEVREDGVYLKFFPFHWGFKRYNFSDIKQFQARTYKPILEYGGWGIRFGDGIAFNTHGNQGVQLILKDGRKILIGSQKAETLAAAIHQQMNS